MDETQKGVDDICLQMVFLIDAHLGTMEKKSSQKHGENEVENCCSGGKLADFNQFFSFSSHKLFLWFFSAFQGHIFPYPCLLKMGLKCCAMKNQILFFQKEAYVGGMIGVHKHCSNHFQLYQQWYC